VGAEEGCHAMRHGEDILAKCAQMRKKRLEQTMTTPDKIFRWLGFCKIKFASRTIEDGVMYGRYSKSSRWQDWRGSSEYKRAMGLFVCFRGPGWVSLFSSPPTTYFLYAGHEGLIEILKASNYVSPCHHATMPPFGGGMFWGLEAHAGLRIGV